MRHTIKTSSFKTACSIRSRSVLIDLAAASLLLVFSWIALERTDLPLTAQTTFDQEFEVHSAHSVGQSFVSEAPNLYRLDVLLARQGANSHPVLLHLQEEQPVAADLVTAEVNASVLEDVSRAIRRPRTYASFTFAPIPDSSGKRFFFYVASPSSRADQPLLVRLQSRDVYPDGAAYLDGAKASADLAFKAFYRSGAFGAATLLLSRLSDEKPFPLSQSAFYVVAFLVYLFLFVRFARLVCTALIGAWEYGTPRRR